MRESEVTDKDGIYNALSTPEEKALYGVGRRWWWNSTKAHWHWLRDDLSWLAYSLWRVVRG